MRRIINLIMNNLILEILDQPLVSLEKFVTPTFRSLEFSCFIKISSEVHDLLSRRKSCCVWDIKLLSLNVRWIKNRFTASSKSSLWILLPAFIVSPWSSFCMESCHDLSGEWLNGLSGFIWSNGLPLLKNSPNMFEFPYDSSSLFTRQS